MSESIQFLERFAPGGPWPITAIAPGSPPVTCMASTAGDVTKFVQQYQGSANFYFTPGARHHIEAKPPSGKYNKADFSGSWWQWVDLDPPKGADLDTWRAEALMGLQLHAPAPSLIVDSGRGYWAFWQRSTFGADLDEVEGINRAFEQAFGADHCHNIDRLARLPGTVNIKTGQLAAVVQWTAGPSWSLPAPTAGVVKQTASKLDFTDAPDEEEDEDRIQIALHARVRPEARFGDKASFRDLWERNLDKLEAAFPATGTNQDPYNGSAADASLVQMLAFYCEKRAGWIKRVMFKSEMVREKWNRDDYIDRTIAQAIEKQENVYEPKKKDAPPVRNAPDKPIIGTSGVEQSAESKKDPNRFVGDYLGADKQADLFEGFVYVRDSNRVLTPEGDMLNSAQFKACYGRRHFVLSRVNTTDTTDAWKAFTESQVFVPPWAHGKGFRPDLPYGEVHQMGIKKLVNTYYDPKVPFSDASPQRFLDHVEKMLPVKEDRDILYAYLAALVQNPGKKFTWCVLLQGVQGNGKSMIGEVLEYCVGPDYSHKPAAGALDSKHNGWMAHSLLAIVEDVHIAHNRMEVVEHLKPLISNRRLPIEPKGVDQVTALTCVNWFLLANRKDAILADPNERRFAMFYCLQQTRQHILDAGMGGSYFPEMYKWLQEEGYAAIRGWLLRYEVPYELDPATGCQVAPATSSADEREEQTRSPVEAAILDLIDREMSGTRGGFLSPHMVDQHLKAEGRIRSGLPFAKRVELFERLGYVPHPALGNGGKASRVIQPDGSRVKLFCKKGESPGGTDREAIAVHYEATQGFGAKK